MRCREVLRHSYTEVPPPVGDSGNIRSGANQSLIKLALLNLVGAKRFGVINQNAVHLKSPLTYRLKQSMTYQLTHNRLRVIYLPDALHCRKIKSSRLGGERP